MKIIVPLLTIGILISCSQDKSILNDKLYDGPWISMDSIVTRYSDEGKVKLIIKAAKELVFDNGDKEWPEGLFLEIYDDETGKLTTTFRSNRAHYYKREDYYMGEGDVLVKNLDNENELSTEQLFWKPRDEQFYTERFVTIKEDGDIHTGEGLTASQDFTEYEITKPTGTLPGNGNL